MNFPVVWCVMSTGGCCTNTIWNSEIALIPFWLIKKWVFTKSSQNSEDQGGHYETQGKENMKKNGQRSAYHKLERSKKSCFPSIFSEQKSPDCHSHDDLHVSQWEVRKFSAPEAWKKKAKDEEKQPEQSRHRGRECNWIYSQLILLLGDQKENTSNQIKSCNR